MTDDTKYILLDRYLTGDCAPAERERVQGWIDAHRSQRAMLEWMGSLKQTAEQLQPSWDPDELWHALESRIEAAEAGARHPPARFVGIAVPRRPASSVHLLRIAAVIALAVGSVALWRLAGSRVPRAEPAGMRTYVTHRGERAVFTLVDGSRITLGAGSRLDVPEAYSGRSREVVLQGQAYFEVARNPVKPFRVHAGRAVTEVLGTKFDVRAYREDATVAVAVAEGSVAVAAADRPPANLVLHRGDLARLDSTGDLRVEHGIAIDQYLAWTQGRLEFVNAPLRDVIPELVRWYDLDIRLGDSNLATRPLTASLGTESADEMLRLLEASLQVRVERHGHVVTLHSSQPH